MSDELRERIVKALRAEADRIEAGVEGGSAEPMGYSFDSEHGFEVDNLSIARRRAQTDLDNDLDEDGWALGAEDIAWGVLVDVESARITQVGRSTQHAYIATYELRPVDDTTPLEILTSECTECGHEEKCPPGGTCSRCGFVDPGCMP